MKTFTIIIQGIALGYLKDNVWKVLFPFNDDHKVRLKFDNVRADDIAGRLGIPLAGRNTMIRISVRNPGIAKAVEGGKFNNFLDITNPDEAHTDVKVKSDDLSQLDAALLTIENAEFSTRDETTHSFRFVRRAGSPAAPSNAPFRKIGNFGEAKLTGDELTIEVTGDGAFAPFNMTFTEDTTLILDNDCPKQTEADGDSVMLYNILEDIADPRVQFKLEKEVAAGASAGAGGTSTTGTTGTTGSSPQPDNSDPEGLPCNMFRASRVGGLP